MNKDKKLNDVYLLYNGSRIDYIDKTFNQIIKSEEENSIIILVYIKEMI